MLGWHCILLQENHHTVYLSVCKIIFFFPTVKMDYGGSNLKSNHKIYGLLLLRHGIEIHTLSHSDSGCIAVATVCLPIRL